jgi:hypothetical protein
MNTKTQEEINKISFKQRAVKLENLYTVFKNLTTDENGNKLYCSCLSKSHRFTQCNFCKRDKECGRCVNLECENYKHPILTNCNMCGIWKLE